MPDDRKRKWPLFGALWRSWKYEITPAGRTVVWLGLLAAIGMVSVRIPMYMVAVALGALFTTAMFAGYYYCPKVALTGRFPEKTIVGQPVTTTFTAHSTRSRPIYDLSLGFFGLPRGLREKSPATVGYLPHAESVRIPVTLLPMRRGLYALPPLRAFTTFPFNLFRVGLSRREMESLLVLPTFSPLKRIELPADRRYQPGGITLTSNVGESPEYIGNREYVPGEPARRLDFRSWARLGKPVVREYQEEYYCRIALILDTWLGKGIVMRPTSPAGSATSPAHRTTNETRSWTVKRTTHQEGDRPARRSILPDLRRTRTARRSARARFEAAVSLSASVADALCNEEHVIDLFAAGPELHIFRSGRHTAHFENVLEILASVQNCSKDPFEVVTPAVAEELSNISTAICIFLDWDVAREHLARTILESGCNLRVVVVRDGPTTIPCDAENIPIRRMTPAEVAAGELEIV